MPQNTTEEASPLIFPLSADPALDESDRTNSEIYFKYLDSAFTQSRIHNLAITGDFGIGKSSLIRTYEHHWEKASGTGRKKCSSKREKGFLYISLGRYESPEKSVKSKGKTETKTERREEKEQTTAEDDEKVSDINMLEHRMLLQIYARFHRKELPLTSFRLIDEAVRWPFPKACFVASFVLAVLLLIFAGSLGNLLTALGIEWLIKVKTWIHLMLYGIVLAEASVGTFMLARALIPRMKLGKMTLKSDNVELEVEKKDSGTYLDRYCLELVYCLERIAEDIQYTVVIEDMDRLDSTACIEVFTRLREMNHLVNLRLDSRKHIRFVYIVNNELLACLNSSKFFDYVLPMAAVLNRKTSEAIFSEQLYRVDRSLAETLKLPAEMPEGDSECSQSKGGKQPGQPCRNTEYAVFREVESESIDSLIVLTAPWIRDFRMQHTILNEYSLLFSLYYTNNRGKKEDREEAVPENGKDAVQLLAFAIYKNFWPEDYAKLRDDESQVLPACHILELSEWKNYELLKVLTDPFHGFLTAKSLHFAGYSEQQIAERLRNFLLSGQNEERKIGRIEAVMQEDVQCIQTLCDYGESLKADDNQSSGRIYEAIIGCMVRCSHWENSWFFRNRRIMECLKILESLEGDMAEKFIDLSRTEPEEDLYAICEDRHSLEYTGRWTKRQVDLFCRGVGNFDENVTIEVEEDMQIKKILLQSRVKDYRQEMQM